MSVVEERGAREKEELMDVEIQADSGSEKEELMEAVEEPSTHKREELIEHGAHVEAEDETGGLAGDADVGLAGSGARGDCARGEPERGVGLEEHSGPEDRRAGQPESASGQFVCDSAPENTSNSCVGRGSEERPMATRPALSRPPLPLLVPETSGGLFSHATSCSRGSALPWRPGRASNDSGVGGRAAWSFWERL